MKETDSSQIGVRLQLDVRQRLETLARLSGIPLSELVRQAMATYVSEGHQTWRESQSQAKQQRGGHRNEPDFLAPDVKLFGTWLLSRPRDLRELLIGIGNDLRRPSNGPSGPAAHLRLLEISPIGGAILEFSEPIPIHLSRSAQVDRMLRHARIAEASTTLVEILGAHEAGEVIGHPLFGFLNLADSHTFEAVARFVDNEYQMLGEPIAVVDPQGRPTHLVVSAIGSIERDHLIMVRGFAQRLTNGNDSRVPEAVDTHLRQGLWCLTVEPPIPVALTADRQLEAIGERARWLWCNRTFAKLCGLGSADQLPAHSPSALLPDGEAANRDCFRKFVERGYRLEGWHCVMRTPGGRSLKGRLRMTGQIVDDHLHRVYGCYEDLTHLLES